jgi:hypothetical protein
MAYWKNCRLMLHMRVIPYNRKPSKLYISSCSFGSEHAVSFLNDFKPGHYMKIPKRSMFLVEVHFLQNYCQGNKRIKSIYLV